MKFPLMDYEFSWCPRNDFTAEFFDHVPNDINIVFYTFVFVEDTLAKSL